MGGGGGGFVDMVTAISAVSFGIAEFSFKNITSDLNLQLWVSYTFQ